VKVRDAIIKLLEHDLNSELFIDFKFHDTIEFGDHTYIEIKDIKDPVYRSHKRDVEFEIEVVDGE
jgi:hypothetical protein